jgi:hypothetical protein
LAGANPARDGAARRRWVEQLRAARAARRLIVARAVEGAGGRGLPWGTQAELATALGVSGSLTAKDIRALLADAKAGPAPGGAA